jgi:FAD-linked oxidoreductase
MNSSSLIWRNWSGSVQVQPRVIAKPRTEAELATLIVQAKKLRVTGAGHSFMPLCATDDTLVSLEELAGAIDIADDRATVWAPAGWSLRRLTQALWEMGYSLPNQGDVNPQSLAGAISTGTHGTGAELGSLSTIARAFRLMLADGSTIECSRTQLPELFEAQRLSLGLFGVVTRIRIDVLPAYKLDERIRLLPLADTLEQFDSLATQHRHAEFFVFPYADHVILKTLHPTNEEVTPKRSPSNDEAIFKFVCDLSSKAPLLTGPLQRVMTKLVQSSHRIGPAYKIFPSTRTVRFEEMEYELPRANGLPALQEVIAWVRKRKLPVTFPFEFRWAAADDIWLSPFNKGPGASISMHQYAKMPWQSLFADAESIFRDHGGRPHWAKRHRVTTADVHRLYPKAAQFCSVRNQFDPGAKFANAHLAELFGIS